MGEKLHTTHENTEDHDKHDGEECNENNNIEGSHKNNIGEDFQSLPSIADEAAIEDHERTNTWELQY